MKYQWWKKANKKKVITALFCVFLLIVGLLIYKHNYMNTAKDGSSRLTATVDIAPVKRADLLKRISLTGQTVSLAQVDIAAKYQGKVMAVNAELGQKVSAGDVLVVQDTQDDDIAILENKAAYAQANYDATTTEATQDASLDKAKADYNKAKATYERDQKLFSIGGISKDDLETQEQTMLDAKASLDTLQNQMNSGVIAAIDSARENALKAQHAVSATEKQRADMILTAPRSGIIGYRQVEVGNMPAVGTKLLSIYDNSTLYVDCTVSEQDLPALSIGQTVDVGIESLNKTYPGRIIYISPASDSTNLTFSLRIEIINPDGTLKSGMFTRTIINSILRPNTLVVSKDAIVEKNGQYSVFVVNEKNEVAERKVQVGARGDDSVEILSGLEEGENVALTNLARLRTGLFVNTNPVPPDGGDTN